MNRLQHFLRAQTLYGLHSPFVYRLYTEVLFARAPGHGRSAADVAWRLACYYGVQPSPTDPLCFDTPDGLFTIVPHPHRDEAAWHSLCEGDLCTVSIDLYGCGLLILNPRLHRQHFLLR